MQKPRNDDCAPEKYTYENWNLHETGTQVIFLTKNNRCGIDKLSVSDLKYIQEFLQFNKESFIHFDYDDSIGIMIDVTLKRERDPIVYQAELDAFNNRFESYRIWDENRIAAKKKTSTQQKMFRIKNLKEELARLESELES